MHQGPSRRSRRGAALLAVTGEGPPLHMRSGQAVSVPRYLGTLAQVTRYPHPPSMEYIEASPVVGTYGVGTK